MHTYVKVTPADDGAPAGKLADVELHFAGGELDGLRLIGFAVWARRDGGGKNVTFPARQFTVRGERRSYTLLRSIENVEAEKRLREFVLQAYKAYEVPLAEGSDRVEEVDALPRSTNVTHSKRAS
jgi:hypothetical protein